MRLATVATCNLNQWALDFDGNLQRIMDSIQQAKALGASYRLGPELETCGYGCQDHFLELDTFEHSWEMIAELLASHHTEDILVDIGAPVMHRGVAYNCRVFLFDGQVLLIRPKIDLAEGGNFFESRYFAKWDRTWNVDEYLLPECVRKVFGQKVCTFGEGIIELIDGTRVGCESCEELWMPTASHQTLALQGVEIIGNGSGSHHVLNKLQKRVELIRGATAKCGGVYLYANQQGCDGDRLYYDGCSMIAVNGEIVKQASQFGLKDVEVIAATVDLDQVKSFRNAQAGRRAQMSIQDGAEHIHVDFELKVKTRRGRVDQSIPVSYWSVEEEIAKGPACWLWDYLRRSGMGGYFLALSGGADSASVAAIVGSMCNMVVDGVKEGGEQGDKLLKDVRKVVGSGVYMPQDGREFAGKVFVTMYMGCEGSSSSETRERARRVAEDVGAKHFEGEIAKAVESVLDVVEGAMNERPKWGEGGDLALQNVQARVRMVVGYLMAQMGRKGLLVLGSSNVDEGLRGYLTKYDCSSADLNPIGGISKTDLRKFLRWAVQGLGYSSLEDVVNAKPTAELMPGGGQEDEVDMGMTYEDLGWFGRLRKVERCGPVEMFRKLTQVWSEELEVIARKVKFFFESYSKNRHKMTVITPSYFAEDYAPDDNRFDMRPFLYNVKWGWQFERLDDEVQLMQLPDEVPPSEQESSEDVGESAQHSDSLCSELS